MSRPLRLGISPCPNDTFVFHALAHGLVPGAPDVEVVFADIDELNTLAVAGELDALKVSVAAVPWLVEDYALLECGGAMGHGVGPLVVTQDSVEGISDVTELGEAGTVLVPGERTTAYLLLRLWAPQLTGDAVEVRRFDEIMPSVARGEHPAGLVIHEARFTYAQHGLRAVADLGQWWEGETGLPLPLGAVVARQDLGLDALVALEDGIRASVEHAWAHPEDSRSWVLEHSQELAPDVVDAHIALYVNELTRDIGDQGRAAISELLDRAAVAGLVPGLDPAD